MPLPEEEVPMNKKQSGIILFCTTIFAFSGGPLVTLPVKQVFATTMTGTYCFIFNSSFINLNSSIIHVGIGYRVLFVICNFLLFFFAFLRVPSRLKKSESIIL